eukprot:TRINITY_DN32984_c0_g1_i1.p1 TRINITY_DN32984_c0_g1~~TRINITY_DN32984_c0_g1_i1.p1  ORF type:complete len:266 (+),score=52.30 TRINITY_DN32984_c0_g1_i1:59-799(+)
MPLSVAAAAAAEVDDSDSDEDAPRVTKAISGRAITFSRQSTGQPAATPTLQLGTPAFKKSSFSKQSKTFDATQRTQSSSPLIPVPSPPVHFPVASDRPRHPEWEVLSLRRKIQVLRKMNALEVGVEPVSASDDKLVSASLRLSAQAPPKEHPQPADSSDEDAAADVGTQTRAFEARLAALKAEKAAAREEAELSRVVPTEERMGPYFVRPGSKSLWQQLHDEGRPQVITLNENRDDQDDDDSCRIL